MSNKLKTSFISIFLLYPAFIVNEAMCLLWNVGSWSMGTSKAHNDCLPSVSSVLNLCHTHNKRLLMCRQCQRIIKHNSYYLVTLGFHWEFCFGLLGHNRFSNYFFLSPCFIVLAIKIGFYLLSIALYVGKTCNPKEHLVFLYTHLRKRYIISL